MADKDITKITEEDTIETFEFTDDDVQEHCFVVESRFKAGNDNYVALLEVDPAIFDEGEEECGHEHAAYGHAVSCGCGHDHAAEETEEEEIPKVAIVGKPNVGKSSLVNKLLGQDRLIVSNVAGTTRDAVDTKVKNHGKEYIFIDTAGLRRKSKIKEEIERFSIIRAVAAVEKADVVVVMIDATEGVTEQDAKIAGIAHERGKGIIIAVNKWDAVEKDNHTMKEHENKIRQILSFIPYANIIYISALTGQRLQKIFDTVDCVILNRTMRIQTGVLNEIVAEAVVMQQPPSDKGKRLKIFYVTQVAVNPPTFVIFVNDKNLMHFSYERYLENRIRDAFGGFMGTSLRFIVRQRQEDKE